MGIFRHSALLLALAWAATAAWAQPDAGDGEAPVRFTAEFEAGLNHPLEYLGGSGTPDDPVHFEVTFPRGRGEAGFFLFRLDGVAGKTVRIDMHTDRARNWNTLNPVFAYIDPFIKKHNSTDAMLANPDLFAAQPPGGAGDGLPSGLGGAELPVTAARNGLFQHWHFMPRSGARAEENIFRVEQTFAEGDGDAVLVAMKVPYTPGLADALMADLQQRWEQEAQSRRQGEPGWAVVQVGESAEGRPLWLVRIGEAMERAPDQADNAPPEGPSQRPCILFYAREHPDEHDTSWVAQGVIDFLLSSHRDARAIRSRFTVLVAPLLDPDGAVANVYETDVIRGFEKDEETPETLAWATWMRDWVDAGNRLDLVFNLHNVESGEGPQLFVFKNDPQRVEMSKALHRAIAARLRGYNVRGAGSTGRFSRRFGGWLRDTFGTHMTFYEVNSQAPRRHMSIYEIKVLGVEMLRGSAQFMYARESMPLRREIERLRQRRYARLERYGYLDRLFHGGQTVFEAERTLEGIEGLEAHLRERGERRNWLRPLYDKIDQGELPPRAPWRDDR